MLIGYARVSTDDQHLDLQRDALQQAGCNKIYTDHQTGIAVDRPGLATVLDVVRPADTLVVWRLDRLGRSLKDLIRLVEQLEQQGVGLKSLQENIDTATTGGRLVFHLFGALAEFERNLIRERTKAGLSAARARGRQGGRPKTLNAERRELALQLHREHKHSIAEICRLMGISKSTLYNYLADAGIDARLAA
jgi:DNA invertase Pin-like site-specific DNA recombinase